MFQLAIPNLVCRTQQKRFKSQAVPVNTWLMLQVLAMHLYQGPQRLPGPAPPLSPCQDPLKPVHSPQVSFCVAPMRLRLHGSCVCWTGSKQGLCACEHDVAISIGLCSCTLHVAVSVVPASWVDIILASESGVGLPMPKLTEIPGTTEGKT